MDILPLWRDLSNFFSTAFVESQGHCCGRDISITSKILVIFEFESFVFKCLQEEKKVRGGVGQEMAGKLVRIQIGKVI